MNIDFKNEVIEYIKSACSKNQFILNIEILNGIHADVYFPDINCAMIFYSIASAGNEQKVSFNELKKSIKIVHLWEDQWIFHKDKIRSKINSLIGITKRIHGRETILNPIDNSRLLEFLKINHLNVPIRAKYKYGLMKDEELVAVMSFSKSRQIIRENVIFNSFELLRFCNKLNETVVGGFSKLLNHFCKTLDPDDIMTYVDCDWSDGHSFMEMGFEYSGRMPALEFWLDIKTGEREYPYRAMKRHNMFLPEFANESETASFLKKNGYKRVYNSGSYKYILMRK